MVLPPIMEWVRVIQAFTEYRQARTVDENDVLQTARYFSLSRNRKTNRKKIAIFTRQVGEG
jgi:hypothetical protein